MIKDKERHMDKQQLRFIDANLFLAIILDQPNKDECLNFLSTFRGKQRVAITCTYAIGEVIEKIYFYS